MVFLKPCCPTADEESLTFVQKETSNLLSQCEYPGDATLVVFKDLHSKRWVDIGNEKRRSLSSKIFWTITYQSQKMQLEKGFCCQWKMYLVTD